MRAARLAWQMTPAWCVPMIWPGETVVIAGSGPSLPETIDCLFCYSIAVRTVAVNDSYRLIHWADILYACDLKWWRWSEGVQDFAGTRITQDQQAAYEYGINWIPSVNRPGLSRDPSVIHQGSNGGYQALNLAVLLGARKIILIAFDHKATTSARSHFFGGYPNRQVSDYQRWNRFKWPTVLPDLQALGVDVVNCTPESGLTVFRSGDLEMELRD